MQNRFSRRRRASILVVVAAVVATATFTAAATAARSADTIKVGNITSVTNLGGTFEGYFNGVKSYFEYINSIGGIKGQKVEFIAKDDGGDPAKNAAAARELVLSRKVVALVGDAGLSEGGAAPLLVKMGVPDIAGWGNDPSWYGQYKNFFTIVSSHGEKKCAPWLADMALGLGVKKFAQFTTDFPISHTDLACHYARLRQGGAKAAVSPFFAGATLADFRPAVKRAMDAGAEDIVTNMDVDKTVRLIQAAEQLGFEGRYVGAVMAPETVLKPLGDLAAKVSGRLYGVSFSALITDNVPEVKLARKHLPAKYRDDQWAIAGWAAGVMFTDAVKAVGPDRAKLLKYMQNLDGYTAHGLLGPTQWSKGNQPARCIIRLVAKGLTFVRAPGIQGKAFSCAKIIDPTKIP